jgi:DNA-binding response OmpR family regulator
MSAILAHDDRGQHRGFLPEFRLVRGLAATREVGRLSVVLLLTGARQPAAAIVPSLSLLAHEVRLVPAETGSLLGAPAAEAALVDARHDLVQARQLLRQLRGAGSAVPLLAIVTEGGWAAVSADWGADDVILDTAGPGEVEARLRLAIGRAAGREPGNPDEVRSGALVINEATYSARIHGKALDLTFKEFELLKFLAGNPGRVFTRSQLLQEVWGYDYFGGTRTVDVHVRRLRAKLGAEDEALIGTVRNVGYRFVPAKPGGRGTAAAPPRELRKSREGDEPRQPHESREFHESGGKNGGPAPGAAGSPTPIAGTPLKEPRPARADR